MNKYNVRFDETYKGFTFGFAIVPAADRSEVEARVQGNVDVWDGCATMYVECETTYAGGDHGTYTERYDVLFDQSDVENTEESVIKHLDMLAASRGWVLA